MMCLETFSINKRRSILSLRELKLKGHTMITCNVPELGKFIASVNKLVFLCIVSAATLAFITANKPEAWWILGFAA